MGVDGVGGRTGQVKDWDVIGIEAELGPISMSYIVCLHVLTPSVFS